MLPSELKLMFLFYLNQNYMKTIFTDIDKNKNKVGTILTVIDAEHIDLIIQLVDKRQTVFRCIKLMLRLSTMIKTHTSSSGLGV